MTLYCGIDLHANNHWLTVIDDSDQRLYERRQPNELESTLKVLDPYRTELEAIAVESTFNWYWLVDGLMDAGYAVKLVHTAAVPQYTGLKHSDDRYDAFHLAHLLRLKILPTGYIYPKAQRGLRDLARQRMRLVQHRTAHTLSVQNQLRRSLGVKVPSRTIQGCSPRGWPSIEDPWLALSVDSGRIAIDTLNQQIELLQRRLLEAVKPTPAFTDLQTVTGIGPILAWTILLEVGDIRRFAKVGQFASYCRGVDSCRTSNNKKKGSNNRKNGNPYLAWAFLEAAHFAIRYLPVAQRFYERKRQQRNGIVAIKALAHKLTRACYYILRDGVAFDPTRLFAH